MAVDFKDLETRLVGAPVRLRRAARRTQSPAAPAAPAAITPSQVVVLPVQPVVSPVAAPATPARVDDASYWVRRRRAEAQTVDPA